MGDFQRTGKTLILPPVTQPAHCAENGRKMKGLCLVDMQHVYLLVHLYITTQYIATIRCWLASHTPNFAAVFPQYVVFMSGVVFVEVRGCLLEQR